MSARVQAYGRRVCGPPLLLRNKHGEYPARRLRSDYPDEDRVLAWIGPGTFVGHKVPPGNDGYWGVVWPSNLIDEFTCEYGDVATAAWIAARMLHPLPDDIF